MYYHVFYSEEGMPDSLDLRTLNMVTDVKMQGSCGSCWAFAAVAVVEGAFTRETGEILIS